MSDRRGCCLVSVAAIAVLSAVAILAATPSSQVTPQAYAPPRTADGKPDLQGIWQVMNTAAFDVEPHTGSLGIPAGTGVIVDPPGGLIPYQPWAAERKTGNFKTRATADPLSKCFMPGVPRLTYLPFPFQIVQTPRYVTIIYEYIHIYRTIYLDRTKHLDGIDFWNGDSIGRWESNTLVVDVADFNDQTWFDAAGNFHGESLHVVERYTPTDRDTIVYDVTIEDPKVFTRPWKMSMLLYRHKEKNARLLEYECHSYAEDAARQGQ